MTTMASVILWLAALWGLPFSCFAFQNGDSKLHFSLPPSLGRESPDDVCFKTSSYPDIHKIHVLLSERMPPLMGFFFFWNPALGRCPLTCSNLNTRLTWQQSSIPPKLLSSEKLRRSSSDLDTNLQINSLLA